MKQEPWPDQAFLNPPVFLWNLGVQTNFASISPQRTLPSQITLKNDFQVCALELFSVVIMVLHYKAAAYFEEKNAFAFFKKEPVIRVFCFKENGSFLKKKI